MRRKQDGAGWSVTTKGLSSRADGTIPAQKTKRLHRDVKRFLLE